MLSDRQYRFVLEYCKDFAPGKAYVRAGYSERGADQSAHTLLKNPEVISAIEERKSALAAMAEADVAVVVRELVARATADPRKVIQTRIGACRYCYGVDHKYHWTRGEYETALNAALSNVDKDGVPRPLPVPDFQGGFGFNRTAPPYPACPECHGEGLARVWIADSRDLDAKSAKLVAGVKQTKDGIELKIPDPMAAITKLGEYLAMFKTKSEVSGPGGGPIQVAALDLNSLSDAQLEAIIASGNGQNEIGGGIGGGTHQLGAGNAIILDAL